MNTIVRIFAKCSRSKTICILYLMRFVNWKKIKYRISIAFRKYTKRIQNKKIQRKYQYNQKEKMLSNYFSEDVTGKQVCLKEYIKRKKENELNIESYWKIKQIKVDEHLVVYYKIFQSVFCGTLVFLEKFVTVLWRNIKTNKSVEQFQTLTNKHANYILFTFRCGKIYLHIYV